VGYLNDVVQDLTTEVKKLNMHKDERAVAALIRTYEEKEATMNRNRNQNEEMIGKLKSAVERLENELQGERNSKEEYEERYKTLSLEMNRYKEQNSALLEQIERLIKEGSQKDSYCVEKEKELRSLLGEFQKQVSMLKAAQEDSSK
jgi:chromosome segregation ATPase